MDFFEQQERARRRSRGLLLWYLLAAAEAELVRLMAATLDCPLPPVLA